MIPRAIQDATQARFYARMQYTMTDDRLMLAYQEARGRGFKRAQGVLSRALCDRFWAAVRKDLSYHFGCEAN